MAGAFESHHKRASVAEMILKPSFSHNKAVWKADVGVEPSLDNGMLTDMAASAHCGMSPKPLLTLCSYVLRRGDVAPGGVA